MALELKGKLIQKMAVQNGTSKSGAGWQKQEIIIETLEQYPRKVCIALWGDKIDEAEKFEINDILTVSLNIESREYNGRWYTDVKAWKFVKDEPVTNQSAPSPAATDDIANISTFTDDNANDDLPF